MEKYCRAGQATVGVMAHAHCMLDNQSYIHTLRICNTYRFSIANTGGKKAPPCYFKRTLSIESFIYPTGAQIGCSKIVPIYIKIYVRGAPTCFGFPQPSSGSYYMCFAKVIIINNQLKYVVYRISWV